MKSIRLLVLWLFCCLGVARAEPNLLQQFLQPVQAFKARFVQRSLDEQGRVLAEDRGWMLLARPQRFRWQVEEPFEQTILSDGYTLWQIDPELNQATRQTLQGGETGGWLWAWTHPDQLDRRFVVEETRQGPGTGLLRLRGRQSDGLQELLLQFEAGQPTRIVSTDALGGRLVIELSRLQIDPPVDEALFRFEPPANMDVLVMDAGAR